MNIAMIQEDLSLRSGSRRFMCEVPKHLQELGHRVKIFSTMLDKKTCFPGFLPLPVEIVPIDEFRFQPIRIINHTLRRDLDYLWSKTMAILEISRRVADWGADAAVFNYCGEHWLYPYFYCLKDCVGAVCLHVTPPVSGSLSLPFQNPTWRRIIVDNVLKFSTKSWRDVSLKNLDLIITHSRYVLTQALKQGVVGLRRSRVVPLGVDHSTFYPTSEEDPYALYAGRIHPYKSLELAVLAMKNTPPDKSLILAGDLENGNVSYKKRLENIAERLGISDRFKIIVSPTNGELVRLIQRCSVFLFPSTIDTFGLVALEAMACGKPIIACRRGGLPEIVGDGGFLLEPSSAQWQDAVKKILSNSSLRQKLGKRALKISDMYSWHNTARSLLNAIK